MLEARATPSTGGTHSATKTGTSSWCGARPSSASHLTKPGFALVGTSSSRGKRYEVNTNLLIFLATRVSVPTALESSQQHGNEVFSMVSPQDSRRPRKADGAVLTACQSGPSESTTIYSQKARPRSTAPPGQPPSLLRLPRNEPSAFPGRPDPRRPRRPFPTGFPPGVSHPASHRQATSALAVRRGRAGAGRDAARLQPPGSPLLPLALQRGAERRRGGEFAADETNT